MMIRNYKKLIPEGMKPVIRSLYRRLKSFSNPPKPAVDRLGNLDLPQEVRATLDYLRPLPSWWHEKGTLPIEVLEAIVQHAAESGLRIAHSMETGCGKSTILFSVLSEDHKVFTLTQSDNSFATIVQSPMLDKSTLEVIEGPTQQTLPNHRFEHKLQLALIDGPHGYPFPDLEYYYVYPQLDTGALLIVDDIHIPNISNLLDFLTADEMFSLVEVVYTTAILRRTSAPTFDPLGDGWGWQGYNAEVAAEYPNLFPE